LILLENIALGRMVEFSVSGDSLEELNRETAALYNAEKLAESGLSEVFEDVLVVRDELKRLTESGSVRRNKIEAQVDDDIRVYQCLQLLQAYGFASTGGQGGNWRYTGE
jgi:hypothetical protein